MAELYIPRIPAAPREQPQRDPKSGRFAKGHTPHNKGKTWDGFMSKEGQRRAAKGWRNLDTHRYKTRPGTAGRGRKQVAAITDGGRLFVFPYIGAAALWLEKRTSGHCRRENIGRCCRENASRRVKKHDWAPGQPKGTSAVNTDHRYKGVRWYFESDIDIWKDKIAR